MQDGIINETGNSRYLRTIAGIRQYAPTFEAFLDLLIKGELPIDLNGINADGWRQLGTALNKASLLADDTAALVGLGTDATPNDMLAALAYKLIAQSYTMDFDKSDWIVGESGKCTMIIKSYEHGLMGNIAECQAFIKVPGVDGDEYLSSAWAAMETYITVAANRDIIVHYPYGEGYSGRLILRNGSNMAGVSGHKLQSKAVVPTKSQQNVTPDGDCYGLSDVTVTPIPDVYEDVSWIEEELSKM